MEQKKVDRKIIDQWIDKNGPDGLLLLAQKSGISSSTIVRARLGAVPRRQRTRDRLCEVLKVSESTLFPSVSSGEDAASAS